VVTCSDSGGPTELVHHGENGFIAAPEPRMLAAAIARVMHDPACAERMGAAGAAFAKTLTWERTIPRLLLP
jgi:glycosyltransferase involved in cell wall biosynthesis